MTQTEALRLAFEALKTIDEAMPFPVAKLAIKECKAALEAKDEPVAYLPPTASPENACYTPPQPVIDESAAKRIATALGWEPKRTWVGLTIDEREQIQQECFGKVPHHVAFAHAIEAKLKELNT